MIDGDDGSHPMSPAFEEPVVKWNKAEVRLPSPRPRGPIKETVHLIDTKTGAEDQLDLKPHLAYIDFDKVDYAEIHEATLANGELSIVMQIHMPGDNYSLIHLTLNSW